MLAASLILVFTRPAPPPTDDSTDTAAAGPEAESAPTVEDRSQPPQDSDIRPDAPQPPAVDPADTTDRPQAAPAPDPLARPSLTPLETAVGRGTSPGGNLVVELDRLGDYPVRTADDAAAICFALSKLPLDQPLPSGPLAFSSPLRELTLLFSQVDSPQAYAVLADRGVVELERLFDEQFDSHDEEVLDDLLLVLQPLVRFQSRGGAERLARAARRPLLPEHPGWNDVLAEVDAEHPHREYLFAELGDSLPAGRIGAAVLAAANRLMRKSRLKQHPFASKAGCAQLEEWIAGDDPVDAARAHLAAAALPYLPADCVDRLLPPASEHADRYVQLEAAWAAAKLEREGGVEILAAAAADVHYSRRASAYLKELDREDAVPEQARDRDFIAQARLSDWLSDPRRFGRPPDAIELLDSRELLWPPAEERRRLWLIAYRYAVEDAAAEAEEDDAGDKPAAERNTGPRPGRASGVALVGGIPLVQIGFDDPDAPAEDLYALYCCRELLQLGGPQLPTEITPAAGRAILSAVNPDFDR